MVCVIILFFAIFQSNSVDAKIIDTNKLSYLDIHANGQVLSSYTPPRTVVVNNILLLIVTFIICSTVSIGLDYKKKKNAY